MIGKIAAVALGGSLGAVLRYLVYFIFEKNHDHSFPWATLTVNLIGSLLIGFLWGWFDRLYISPGLRLFIFVGLLGSFTTFSTFAFDVFSLSRNNFFAPAFLYILATNVIGITLAFGGYYLSKSM